MDFYKVDLKNLLKMIFQDLDIYTDTLLYIWIDKNRIKFGTDNSASFKIKKGTKYNLVNDKKLEDVPEMYMDLSIRIISLLEPYFKVKDVFIEKGKIIFYKEDYEKN
jgi:hypothetical protein